jgi:hypothetical protein
MHRPLKRLEQSTLLWNNLKRKVTVSSTRLTFRGVKVNLEYKNQHQSADKFRLP